LEFVDRLEACTGFPPGAFGTFRCQATVDAETSHQVFELMDGLPLAAAHEELVDLAALQTADFLVAAGDELLTRADVSVPASWSRWRT
jgi:hypothetical protein